MEIVRFSTKVGPSPQFGKKPNYFLFKLWQGASIRQSLVGWMDGRMVPERNSGRLIPPLQSYLCHWFFCMPFRLMCLMINRTGKDSNKHQCDLSLTAKAWKQYIDRVDRHLSINCGIYICITCGGWGGIIFFTSWEPSISADYVARNSVIRGYY